MKRCSKCELVKPLDCFSKGTNTKDGKFIWCRDCQREYDRNKNFKLREKRREYSRNYSKTEAGKRNHSRIERESYQKFKAREACRARTRYYVKTGKMKKLPCEVCGELKVQAHHEDYNNAWLVKWFCDYHHKVVEGKSYDSSKSI